MQFQADILPCRIIRPKMIDSTAQGVAHLAGVTLGLWKGKRDLQKLQKLDKTFFPQMRPAQRKELYKGWLKAVDKARS